MAIGMIPALAMVIVCGVLFGHYLRPFWRSLRFWTWRNTPYTVTGHEPPPGYDEWYYPDGHRK